MNATYQIPLDVGAQSFPIVLGGIQYQLSFIYRVANGGGWFLDMVRSDNSDAIFGIPLVLGTDLLEPYRYKGFGSLFVSLDGGSKNAPTYEDMGRKILLTWRENG